MKTISFRSSVTALLAASIFVALALTSAAQAAPGDVYTLEVSGSGNGSGGSGSTGRILQVDPASGAVLREVVPTGPGVEPLHHPTGLDVDAQGYLIIVDQDGYGSVYAPPGRSVIHGCDPDGCGALLRVNPTTGAATVISTGPYWRDPTSVVLPADRDLYDDEVGGPYADGSSPDDELVVTDSRDSSIIGVSAANGDQRVMYSNAGRSVRAQKHTGLRYPWGIVREPAPASDSILVANTGGRPGYALVGQRGCDDNPRARGRVEHDGYVVRLTPDGKIEDYICSAAFRRPRGIVMTRDGRAFVTNPKAGYDSNSPSPVSGIVRMDPDDPRDGGLISIGENLATPGGITLTYSGDGLLVADAATLSRGSCNVGCGSLVAVDPLSGDQCIVSPPAISEIGHESCTGSTTFEPGLNYRYPVAVAVDRGTGAIRPTPPSDAARLPPLFGPQDGTELVQPPTTPPALRRLVLDGLGDWATVTITCAGSPCSPKSIVLRSGPNTPPGPLGVTFPAASPLQGPFLVAINKHRNLKVDPGSGEDVFRTARFTVDPDADLGVKVTSRDCRPIACPEPVIK